MAVTVGPHRNIKTGNLVSDGCPTSTKPINGLSHPNVVVVQADKESIQDYVAQLFVDAPHTNLTVNYDDENNQLSFSAYISSEPENGFFDKKPFWRRCFFTRKYLD